MSGRPILRLGTLKGVAQFQEHLQTLGLKIPCDGEIVSGSESPLRKPLVGGEIKIGNRIAVHPMEGWDGTADGNPSEHSIRRWKRFGQSGGKLIWGGEAVPFRTEDARIQINSWRRSTPRKDSRSCGKF